MGTATVEDISRTIPARGNIDITTKNIMGVRIPKVTLTENKYDYSEKIRGSVYASSKLYDASEKFDSAYPQLMKLAETEETIRRLGEEIKKPKEESTPSNT